MRTHQANLSQRAPLLSAVDEQKLLMMAAQCSAINSTMAPNLGSKLVDKNDYESHTKRSLLVPFIGSLVGWQEKTDSDTFTINPDTVHAFQQIGEVVDGKITSFEGNPKKTVVLEMVSEGYVNNTPVPLGVNISGVVPTEQGANGRMYAYIMMPGTTTTEQKILRARSNVTRAELESIGEIVPGDLTLGVAAVDTREPGESETKKIHMVPINSTLDLFLRKHGHHIGIDDFSVVDNSGLKYYNSNDATIGNAIALAHQLTAIPLDDMTKFSVHIERADAPSWTTEQGVIDNGATNRMTHKYNAFLKLGYSIQHTEK